MSPRGLGIDGRTLTLLVGGTLAAAGLGYAGAALLDGGGVTRSHVAVAVRLPAATPEAAENSDITLPAAPDPTRPAASPAPGPAAVAPVVPAAPGPVPAAPAAAGGGRAGAPPPRTARTTTTAPAPAPDPQQESEPRPTPDDSRPAPADPAGPSVPLAQFTIAAGDLAPDDPAARRQLAATARRTGLSAGARADIDWVRRLDAALGASRFPGRRAAVGRTLRVNAWWYAHRDAPARRVLVRDPDGLIYSYGPGHGFALNPVGTAGRWQRLNDDVPDAQLAAALLGVAVTDDRGGRATLLWEYYDVPGAPAAIRPTPSGMAQARIARLLATAYRAQGDAAFLAGARDALATLDVDVGAGGVRSMVAEPGRTDAAPWYVERAYPGADPWMGAALNGFMVAVLELRAVQDALTGATDPAAQAVAAEAGRLADAGAASLDRFLPLHDTGRWSYYGLRSPGHPWRTYEANVTYHCYHVTLLRSLAARYPDTGFAAYASRWDADAARAGVTCG